MAEALKNNLLRLAQVRTVGMGKGQYDLAICLNPCAIDRSTRGMRGAERASEIALPEGKGSAFWRLRFGVIRVYG